MTRRDPEARRTAIIAAAADLIVERGPERLTHRLVADRADVPLGSTTAYFTSLDDLRAQALAHLAAELDADLDTLRHDVGDPDLSADDLVTLLANYLRDRRRVAADLSLMSAAAYDPDLRDLALRWQETLIDLLAVRVGRDGAVALALLVDGLTVHAALHDEPLPRHLLLTLAEPFLNRAESTRRRAHPVKDHR
ncbi:TetR/AcrR family transcriptional regulator [Gordonia shandongensis]|uniref:TetR/AcrR family transcriptional regulator n=1 Tax=Gordonia shandongensis TaxID=376351 RepID=UPI00042789AF|nr:TetR family transcriptional regulator [Gordonia shandongensis]